MLYWISKLLAEEHTFFHVFSYQTLRGILAVASALLLSLILGPWMIEGQSRYQIGQQVRTDGPQTHLNKKGSPTMGGALIIVAIAVSTLLWADLTNRYVWTTLGNMNANGLVGFYDDYLKLVGGNSKGLIARWKYLLLSIARLGAAFALWFTARTPDETTRFMPLVKQFALPLSAFGFITLTYLMIVGMSNAVNFTDGLDGLAIMPSAMVAGGLGIFVLETASVILQVASFKLTGKRIFRMAPIHHHFEQLGWTEPQIVIRFWIISVMLALAGLSTLKLR